MVPLLTFERNELQRRDWIRWKEHGKSFSMVTLTFRFDRSMPAKKATKERRDVQKMEKKSQSRCPKADRNG